jgi:hypothetical protein
MDKYISAAATLKQLINLNQSVVDASAAEPVWKIIVFDKYGQDIISPLLNIRDLRELGVTLHLYVFFFAKLKKSQKYFFLNK